MGLIVVDSGVRQIIALAPAARQVIAAGNLRGNPGTDGDPGVPGASVELQVTATHIQWRRVGDDAWTDLLALADIEGAPG